MYTIKRRDCLIDLYIVKGFLGEYSRMSLIKKHAKKVLELSNMIECFLDYVNKLFDKKTMKHIVK